MIRNRDERKRAGVRGEERRGEERTAADDAAAVAVVAWLGRRAVWTERAAASGVVRVRLGDGVALDIFRGTEVGPGSAEAPAALSGGEKVVLLCG